MQEWVGDVSDFNFLAMPFEDGWPVLSLAVSLFPPAEYSWCTHQSTVAVLIIVQVANEVGGPENWTQISALAGVWTLNLRFENYTNFGNKSTIMVKFIYGNVDTVVDCQVWGIKSPWGRKYIPTFLLCMHLLLKLTIKCYTTHTQWVRWWDSKH